MDNLLDFIPKLPVAELAEYITDKTGETFSFLFDPIKAFSQTVIDLMTSTLTAIPAVILIALVALLAFFASGKKFGLAIFSVVGLWFIHNHGRHQSNRHAVLVDGRHRFDDRCSWIGP